MNFGRKPLIVAVAALLGAGFQLASAKTTVRSEMAGDWEGSAPIIVNWLTNKAIHLKLKIEPDGTTTGTVGDAQLVGGKLKSNRSALGRKLRLKTDYIIVGALSGDLIASEGIQRKGVSIPLNYQTNSFQGGFHSAGQKLGGKKSGIVTAGPLILIRKSEPQ